MAELVESTEENQGVQRRRQRQLKGMNSPKRQSTRDTLRRKLK